MRIWSIHPKYLDSKGLVALWRETLLAKKVLAGKTKGYKNHPQLVRFREMTTPLEAINTYLSDVHEESLRRGYRFDDTKFSSSSSGERMSVTSGQLEYEWEHLLGKLKLRDPDSFHKLKKLTEIEAHPMFVVRSGSIANWERLSAAP